MADKSAYVPVDASGATGGKTDLDIDLDGDFFGSNNNDNNKKLVAPPVTAQPKSESQEEPKYAAKVPSAVSTAHAKSPASSASAPTIGVSVKPKPQYQKAKSYKKTVAYKAK